MAVEASDQMVILHITGSWRHRSGVDADNAAGRHRRFDLRGFEVIVEQFGDAALGQRAPVLESVRPRKCTVNVGQRRRRGEQKGTILLRPSKEPKTIDLKGVNAKGKDIGDREKAMKQLKRAAKNNAEVTIQTEEKGGKKVETRGFLPRGF